MSDRTAPPAVAEPTPPWGVRAYGLDTNVLARLVLGDDANQARTALAAIEAAIADGRSVLISPTVWLELEWVLRSRARLDRDRIASVFDAILDTEGFVFPAWPAVEQALAWYRDDGADFADALHAALYGSAEELSRASPSARSRAANRETYLEGRRAMSEHATKQSSCTANCSVFPYAADGARLLTFDRAAARLPGAVALG